MSESKNTQQLDLSVLDSLSPDERKVALQILEEYSKSGESEMFEKMLLEDYEEIPVDIETFLHDPDYLGKGLTTDEGKFTVFPYWENMLKKLFPDSLTTSYNTLILSGAIGLGKSFIAVICMLYMLYRMLCLKDPYKHFGLQPIDHITFSIMNITLDAAKGVAWSKIQELLQLSPWFMNHGRVSKSQNPEWQPNENIELIYGSQPRHVIGRAVYCSFEDEVSFQTNSDIEKQKKKARELISSIDARMSSRFMKGEKLPTLHILASSKRTDQSFLETYIDMKKKNESKTTLIIDEPQWVIRTDKDSPNKFAVAVGNKFLDSEVLPLTATEDDYQIYRDKGYSILMVPMGYHEQFLDDINIALTDIAGISTSNSTSYISGVRWTKCRSDTIENPFTREILEVGNNPEDKEQYYDFFDLTKIPKDIKSKPIFIHLDMSMSGDKTGIAGVAIKGKKPHEEGIPDSKELYYQLAFSVSIKAPKGYQISFEKNRQFIYWLKQQGFNIKGVSMDTFQSADLFQQLQSHGFNCSIISVDRVKDRICPPYQTFKNAIYEERLVTYKTKLLTAEVVGLVRDGNGKIDHSPAGINCFTGDTKIQLVDGRSLTMLELKDEFEKGKENFVYSINEKEQKIEPKLIENVFCSGKDAQLLKVTLDNGESVRCTPEHLFMLRDGTYIEAQDLIPGDSLMPLYTKVSSEGLTGYRLYYEPFEDAWHYEHRQFAEDVLDEKYLVHHKDCNKLNNNPTNLIWCSKSAHQKIHSEMQTGAQSIEAREKRRSSVTKYHEDNKSEAAYWTRYHKDMSAEEALQCHINIKQKAQDKKTAHENKIIEINKLFNIDYYNLSKEQQRSYMSKYDNYIRGFDVILSEQTVAEIAAEKIKLVEKEYDVNFNQLTESERRHYSMLYARQHSDSYENISDKLSENHKKGKYVNAKNALAANNAKLKMLKTLFPTIDKDKFKDMFGFDYDSLAASKKGIYSNRYRQKLYEVLNHKVVSIEILDEREDVYDITVKDNHNFALAIGIFVHNSKDQCDAVCGSLYNASLHAEEFAYDYGESAEQILRLNSDDDDDGIKQLTLNLEDELKHFAPKLQPVNISNINNKTQNFSMYDDIIIL